MLSFLGGVSCVRWRELFAVGGGGRTARDDDLAVRGRRGRALIRLLSGSSGGVSLVFFTNLIALGAIGCGVVTLFSISYLAGLVGAVSGFGGTGGARRAGAGGAVCLLLGITTRRTGARRIGNSFARPSSMSYSSSVERLPLSSS